MADQVIALPPDSTGKKVDTSELAVGANTVERQRIVLSDDSAAAGLAKVMGTQPVGTEQALVTRPIPGAPQATYLDTTHANPLLEIAISFNAGGTTPIINAIAGKVIRIWKLVLWVNGSCNVTIQDGNTPLLGPMTNEQGGGLTLPRDSDPWFTCAVNSPFQITLDVTAQVVGRAYYTQG